MKMFTELVEDVKYLNEGKGDSKSLFIEGVFLQSNIKNRNGRVYPKEVMQKEVARYIQESVDAKRAFGELGHPEGPTINLDRVSHMIVSLKEDGDNFIGKAKVMDTPQGMIVQNFIKEGAQLGVSSRGMGSIKEVDGTSVVQEDFYLATAGDIVADPSAPDAFVNGIMEGRDWIWDNGIIHESEIAKMEQKIKNAAMNDIEIIMLEQFRTFMSKI